MFKVKLIKVKTLILTNFNFLTHLLFSGSLFYTIFFFNRYINGFHTYLIQNYEYFMIIKFNTNKVIN